MGKYLQMLDELYQPEKEDHISIKYEVTKPTKALLAPFVSANSKDTQFISDSRFQGIGSAHQEDKTVKASNRELTKPTKDFHDVNDRKPTDHEIAEHKINGLKLHDDRVFVRQKLIGIYGAKRLDIVNKYLEQWRLGVEAEPVKIKQENAGRHRANAWINEDNFTNQK